ncbi:MAG: hypothetical protein ACK5MI_07015 [Mangrovibacterium sp.]
MRQTFNTVKYYAFWLIFFLIFKVFFLAYNHAIFFGLPASEIWGIFRHGIIMDFSAAAYFTVLPALLFTFGFFIPNKIVPITIKCYTIIALIFLSTLGIVDMGLYQEWGSRINALALMYLNDLGGIYTSVTTKQTILTPIALVLIVCLFARMYNLILTTPKLRKEQYNLLSSFISLIVAAALIIPVRRDLDRAPLNHSSVYFSTNLASNQAATITFGTLVIPL